MTAKYDISLNRGSNYQLWLQYQNDDGIPVGLTGYNAKLTVSRYVTENVPVLIADTKGLTYGYTGGITTGISGPGGILLNTNFDGGYNIGGMLILIGDTPTKNFNQGKYFYQLDLMIGNGTTYSQRLLQGRVNIEGNSY